MKMIYAGIGGVAENYLYNCTRNTGCQWPFYIPIIDFTDFILYFDFPGKPTDWTINIVTCDGDVIDISNFCNYVIAQKPDNSWYGVFTQIDPTVSVPSVAFYIDATFTIGGSFKYFSNQFKYEPCGYVTKVEACYKDTAIGADAYDCNGVYYGFHAGNGTPIGNVLLRYYHHAYIRQAEIIENSNKMSFTLFNSRNAYKNSFTREYNFQFELVPTFYKDVLIGIFNRGNIGINGISYTLADAQEITITNDSLKWWKMDIKLSSLCRQFFSCTPTTCIPEPPECVNDFTTAEYIPTEGEFDEHIHLSGGIFNAGDSIIWTLYIGASLIDSGTSTTADIYFSSPLDVETNCYTFNWEKDCACAPSS